MEQNSLENCENEGQYVNKVDGVCKRFCDIDSPKVLRHPLQAFNSPVMVNPKVQSSVTITPYRYHGCKVIHEEIENQENIDPKRLFHSNSDHTAQKSREPANVGISPNTSSPFSYPLILEGCHLSSSSSSSYKSTLGQSGRHQEVNNCNYGSPKTPFTTPRGKSLVLGNYTEHSHPSRAGNDSEGCDSLHSKVICNGGHRIGNTGWTLTRGLVSGNGSLSSSTGSSHKNVVTPSKSSCSSGVSDRSVFQTPGSYCSSSSENRVVTPQQRCKGYKHKLNPFDVGVDHLHLPTVSPSLFRQVVSPVYEKFQWSIDELALLKPANIETSPYNQSEGSTDPEYEIQAQAAIDKFFSRQPVVPSPWMGSNKSISLVSMNLAPEKDVSSNPVPTSRTRTISCQTELSLPMVLPESVEAALEPYLTFTQDQCCQGTVETEECNNLNNTTLRRKLLFSAEDLVNATPMCSPRGTASSESSASSSPVAPLPLHDDDDINREFNAEDTKGLQWCAEIFQPSFNNLIDPSQRRHLPSTPPFPSEQVTEKDLIRASVLPRKYDGFSSPQYESEPMHSLDLSPIEGQICSTFQRRCLSSTDLSPIQQNTNCESSECMLTIPSGAEIAHPKCRISLSVPSNVDSPSVDGISNTGCEIQTYNSKGDDRSTFELRDFDNVNMVCDKSEEVVSNSSEKISGSSVISHNALGTCSPKSKTFVPKSSPASVSKVFHGEVVLVEASQSNTQEPVLVHGSNSKGQEMENQENGNTVQKKSPASKAENSPSSNSAHFSSSPIRDCKTVSYSPPLSPILCRSISVQSQGDQVKSQGHYGEDCQFTRGDVSQSTVLSVDMEVRSTTEEEITLDEGVSSVGTAKLGYPMTNVKNFTDIQEFSSVCDMDTDLQHSFEISVCHEAKSQESGYQTGSMQSTNFSMTTFTSNSTICSSASFQKDRLPSIFGTDGSNFYAISRVNDRKTQSHSNMNYQNHVE
ncbi:uncharacterized protein bora [Palaemon carinicauda]|uniref:uncharacterized protein bora n=1 Tax=Palaemon carinicauda TaxID=392227 RepID=UPI0035B66E6A